MPTIDEDLDTIAQGLRTERITYGMDSNHEEALTRIRAALAHLTEAAWLTAYGTDEGDTAACIPGEYKRRLAAWLEAERLRQSGKGE